MKRRILWVWSVGMAAALLVAYPTVSYASKLSTYQQKAQQLQNQQKKTQQSIAVLGHQETSIRGQIDQIRTQIQSLQSQIVSTQVQLGKRDAQIARLKSKMKRTQVQVSQQYAALKQRIRVMYEDGQASYLDVLFSSTSFADLLDRMYTLSIIADEDQHMLHQIQANQAALKAANLTLIAQQGAQKKTYAALTIQQNQQQSLQVHESALLNQVHDAKLKQEADLNSETSAMKNLRSLIARLKAQEGSYTGPASGWTWPVPGYKDVTSPYGWRTWPDGTREFHDGIDIGAPVGAKMVSVTNGKVLYAGPASGFGDWIVIESSGGLLEIYGHMYAYQIQVSPGQVVSKGQQIASVGDNGNSTGPHLHITIATGFDSNGFPISINPTQHI